MFFDLDFPINAIRILTRYRPDGRSLHFIVLTLCCAVGSPGAVALELIKDERWELDADLAAGYGLFHSNESYAQLRTDEGSTSWNEGYYHAGLSGHFTLDSRGEIYGAWSYMGTAVWQDGDAAGYTTGSERRNAVENAYAGWRSNDLFPALGKNGIDISGGRQEYKIGSGFLVEGDAVNFGKGFDALADASLAPGSLDRGGAYWLAPRLAFDKTALLKLGQKQWRGEFFWFESDNNAQADTEMAGTNLMYVNKEYGTIGLTWLHGLSVDDAFAEFLGYTERDGQDTVSLRYEGSAGIKNLALSGEIVSQDNGAMGDDRAWYAEAGWTFSDNSWRPGIGARYSTFSSHFDPLFYGFSTGYGTWFQGEVAGNYAGPYNTNADIWHGYVAAQPFSTLTIGALYFHFDSRNDDPGHLDADEIDLYAEWAISAQISISPVIGFYTPDRSAAEGGVQLGNDDTNLYLQLMLTASF